MKLSLLLLFLALGFACAGPQWLTPEARLNAAARRGDVARARALLHDAVVRDPSLSALSRRAGARARTPLAEAAAAGHAELCKLLLLFARCRDAIDAADDAGATALALAAARGDLALVRLLRAHGAAVGGGAAAARRPAAAPLALAADGGHADVCLYLALEVRARARAGERSLSARSGERPIPPSH